jgi:hypothetical protein
MDREQIERAAALQPGQSKPDAHIDVSPSIGASQHIDAELGVTKPLRASQGDDITHPGQPADADVDTQQQIDGGLDTPVDTKLDVANFQPGAAGAGSLDTLARPFDED